MTLDANPNHPRTGNIKRIVIRHTPDPSVQLLLLQQRGRRRRARPAAGAARRRAIQSGPHRHAAAKGEPDVHLHEHEDAGAGQARGARGDPLGDRLRGIEANLVKDTFTVHQAFLPSGFPAALDGTIRSASTRPREGPARRGRLRRRSRADLRSRLELAPGRDRAGAAGAVRPGRHQADAAGRRGAAGADQDPGAAAPARRSRSGARDYFDPHSNAQTFCENTDNSDNSKNRTTAWQQALAGQGADRARRRRRCARRTRASGCDVSARCSTTCRSAGPFAIMLQEVGTVVMRKPATGLVQGPLSDRTVYARMAKA